MRLPVCFGPNLGTLDLPQLFTEDNLWRWSYDRIAAFQFYQGHIGPIGVDLGERFCQPNTFERLVEAQAFTKLKAAGILLELQMTGNMGPDVVRQLAARIAGAGGQLGALCYDHTIVKDEHFCPPETFAGYYVPTLRAQHPGIIIGAYVSWSVGSTVETVLSRVQAWDEYGGRPDFLRMDVDYNQRQLYTSAAHDQIRLMCQSRGMTHQVVINAREGLTDAQYIPEATAWFDRAKALGFDAFAVQSWASTPSEEARQLPHNLPEGAPDAHASLVRHCLEALA